MVKREFIDGRLAQENLSFRNLMPSPEGLFPGRDVDPGHPPRDAIYCWVAKNSDGSRPRKVGNEGIEVKKGGLGLLLVPVGTGNDWIGLMLAPFRPKIHIFKRGDDIRVTASRVALNQELSIGSILDRE